jgi:hypothetical protein
VPSFENEPEIQDYGHSLIEMIMAKGSNRQRSYQCIRKTCIGTEAMSDKASKSLEMGSFYRNDPFKRKSINALFKKILTKQNSC